MTQPTYCIRRWDEVFENSQSRQHRRLSWVPVPNKHDGKSYRRLMAHENGLALYGAWCLLVQIASKCPVRGVLADEDGPLDAEDFAAKTGAPAKLFSEALEMLTHPKIGWVAVVSPTETVGTPTAEQQSDNSLVPNSALEENRTEENGRKCNDTADAAGSLRENSSKTKRAPKTQQQLVPDHLDALIAAWNELPTGIAPRCAKRTAKLVAAFGRANSQHEVQTALSDVAKLMAAIRESPFLHGQGWFTFSWLFSKDRSGEWNAIKIIKGNYRDRSNAKPKSAARWQGDASDFDHLTVAAPAAAAAGADPELESRSA